MNHKQVVLSVKDQNEKDILVALLSEAGYEGFEEQEDSLLAYISTGGFDKEYLDTVASLLAVSFHVNNVEKINWNKQWEENFEPVIVDDFCTIRADFHSIRIRTKYEILITPKMSFGTGHHATTQLMIRGMRDINFTDSGVLDFGTGTGVLAILAEKLGADAICAIDNDDWSYQNAVENALMNGVSKIDFYLSSLEGVHQSGFDIILANINRHILLQYMKDLYHKTNFGGIVLLSGLLIEDSNIVKEAAEKEGLTFIEECQLNNWILLKFSKL